MKTRTRNSVGTSNHSTAQPAEHAWAGLRSAMGSSATLVVSVLVFGGLSVSAQDNPSLTISRAEAFAVSAPLRDLAKLPAQPEYGFRMPEPVREIQRSPAGPVVDVVEQSSSSPASNFSIGLNFLGVGNGFPGYTGKDPRPDTNLGVGDTQIVQWAASSYAVFDKATGTALTGAISRSTLFQGSRHICSIITARQHSSVGQGGASLAAGRKHRRFSLYDLCGGFDQPGCDGDLLPVWVPAGQLQSRRFLELGEPGPMATTSTSRSSTEAPPLATESARITGQRCWQATLRRRRSVSSYRPWMLASPTDVDSSVPPPAGQDELFATLFDDASHIAVYSLHPDFANPADSFLTGNNASQLITVPAFNPGCNGAWVAYCVPQKDISQLLEVRAAASFVSPTGTTIRRRASKQPRQNRSLRSTGIW